MATLALSTANPRLQSPSLAMAAEDGSDRTVAAASADAFATLLDQLGQATSTPSPVTVASTAALPAPASAVTLPTPTPLALPADAATDPIEAPTPVQKNGGKTEADKDDAAEDPPHDLEAIAQPDATAQPTILPASAALPLLIPFETAATEPGETATLPPSEQPVVGSVPSSAKPVASSPMHQPSADAQLVAEAAPQQPSSDSVVASPLKEKSTGSPAQATTSPVPEAEPTAPLERAITAQSRIGPMSPPIPANEAAIKPGDASKESAVASTLESSGTNNRIAVATPLPATTVPPPISPPTAVTADSVLAVPPPTARPNIDRPATASAAASASPSSKSTQADSAAIASSPPAAVLDTAPIATPALPVLAPTSAAPTTVPRLPNATPPPPAAQVATALVQPVEVMLTSPSPTEPHVTTIQITPVELGRVDIRIERPSGGSAKIELVAERPETLSRLVHDQSVLHQALDQAGLAVGNRTIEFSLAPVPPADISSGTSSGTLNNGTAFGDGSGGGASHRQGGRYPNQGFAADDTGSPRSTTFRSVRSGIDITA